MTGFFGAERLVGNDSCPPSERTTENQDDMIEKVTLRLSDDGRLLPEGGVGCEEMNPKALMLYAGAKCAGLTVLQIMKRERMAPKRFEITLTGDMTTDTVQAETEFRSFRAIYNIECADDREQIKASRAVKLGQERYCGMMNMLRKIAPVTYETAMVSTGAVAERV